MMRCGRPIAALPLLLVAACRGVPINVATPQPLAVDVTLRVDIFQHKVEATADAEPVTPRRATGTSDAAGRRRDRLGEIQSFKNSRIVGEDRTGRLRILRLPAGDYGQQVERAVRAENDDRSALMRAEAAQRRVPLATVEAEQAAKWRERAFPGEWIEVQQDEATWRWVQKSPDDAAPRVEPTPGA